MKTVRISNGYVLHVYLIKEKALSDDWMEEVKENMSKHEDEMSNAHEDWDFSLSAKNLLEAMQDHYCVMIIDAIIDECASNVVEHWEKFSPKRLEEPKYKALVELLKVRKREENKNEEIT